MEEVIDDDRKANQSFQYLLPSQVDFEDSSQVRKEMATEQTLKGKLALVSGSARGIGAATCVELASRYVFDPFWAVQFGS